MRAFNYSTRTKLAVLLLILFALFTNSQLVLTSSSVKFLLKKISLFDTAPGESQHTSSTKVEQTVVTPVATAPPIARDKATLYEKRFPALQNALPPSAVVGYMTDKGGIYGTRADYYLTQYSLAPVIITDDINQDLIVGNFSNSAIMQNMAASNTLFCLKVFEHISDEATNMPNSDGKLILTTPQGQPPDFNGKPFERCSTVNFVLIQDFGDGVALFKRENK